MSLIPMAILPVEQARIFHPVWTTTLSVRFERPARIHACSNTVQNYCTPQSTHHLEKKLPISAYVPTLSFAIRVYHSLRD